MSGSVGRYCFGRSRPLDRPRDCRPRHRWSHAGRCGGLVFDVVLALPVFFALGKPQYPQLRLVGDYGVQLRW